MEPKVIVRTRRRRTPLPPPETPQPANVRNWLIYAALAVGIAALMTDGYLTDSPSHPPLPDLSQAIDVRSTIGQSADSLQVVVGWELTLSDPGGRPDSVRVRVVPRLGDSVVLKQPASQLADTAFLPTPAPGQTVSGFSCVAAQYREEPLEENCTPWQYVRPAATVGASPTRAATVTANRIVVQPSGLQVDPDVGGRCVGWQRAHPNQSVWVVVNSTAIPECTGPNRKPTVAQFCAFAVLPDGRRVKTENSMNNRYCDELFEEWTRERYS